MESFASSMTELLWRNGVAVVPLALVVAAICRWLPCRPATRHAMWVLVLLWFVSPPILQGPLLQEAPPELVSAGVDVPLLPVEPITHEGTGAQSRVDDSQIEAESPKDTTATRPVVHMQAESGDDASPANAEESVKPSGSASPLVPDALRLASVEASNGVDTGAEWTLGAADSFSSTPAAASATHAIASPNEQSDREKSSSLVDTPGLGLRTGVDSPTVISGSNVAQIAAKQPESELSLADNISRNSDLTFQISDSEIADRANVGAIGKESTAGFSNLKLTRDGNATTIEPLIADSVTTDTSEAILATDQPAIAPVPAVAARDSSDSSLSEADVSSTPAWGPWAARFGRLRDDVAGWSILPVRVWLAGCAAVLLIYAIRVLGMFWRLRNARTATDEIQELVDSLSREMGLRRLPRATMVRSAISPMVCCLGRPRLILPDVLWQELDDLGRRALLCHELAHLRRLDHWVKRLEAVVLAAYWWHPLTWWVHRRIDEEAELCCDAWVTWLMPRGRRAYAEALLTTKAFAGGRDWVSAGTTIGVLSGKAGRFARRITMVMTKRTSPRISVGGWGLAVCLLMVGWLVTPSEACDTKAKATKTKATAAVGYAAAPAPVASGIRVARPTGVSEATPPAPPAPPLPPSVFAAPLPPSPPVIVQAQRGPTPFMPLAGVLGQHRDRNDDDRDIAELEARIERLERQIDRLSEAIERLADGDGPRSDARGRAESDRRAEGRAMAQAEREMAAELARQSADVARARALRDTERVQRDVQEAYRDAQRARREGERAARQTQRQSRARGVSDDGDKYSEFYQLTGGKLEAMVKLMSRQDVPILISPRPDGIEVQGTAREHDIFEGFYKIIEPNAVERSYTMTKGKLEDLQALMSRNDIATYIRNSSDSITVLDEEANQEAIAAFIRMIDPDGPKSKDEKDLRSSNKDGGAGTGSLWRQATDLGVTNSSSTLVNDPETMRQMAEESAKAAEELKQKADQARMEVEGPSVDPQSLLKEAARKEAEAINLKLRAELIEKGDAGQDRNFDL